MLGAAYYRAADIGACLAIADQIIDGDRPSALRALLDAGDRLSAIAETSAAASGLRVSAREAYMQAANYIFASTYFINPRDRPTPLLSTGCVIRISGTKPPRYVDPPVDYFPFPYEKTTLPGYLFRVDNSGKQRPLLILNNGNDGGMISAWTMGVAAALDRGYNAYTFYGPGQGTALLKQKPSLSARLGKGDLPFAGLSAHPSRGRSKPNRSPWDQRGRVLGSTRGRVRTPSAACVADPGVWDVSTAWTRTLPKPALDLLAEGTEIRQSHPRRPQIEPKSDWLLSFCARAPLAEFALPGVQSGSAIQPGRRCEANPLSNADNRS